MYNSLHFLNLLQYLKIYTKFTLRPFEKTIKPGYMKTLMKEHDAGGISYLPAHNPPFD